jgi:hypothetical protein
MSALRKKSRRTDTRRKSSTFSRMLAVLVILIIYLVSHDGSVLSLLKLLAQGLVNP